MSRIHGFFVLTIVPFGLSWAQTVAKAPVIEGRLSENFSAERTIEPNTVHRYLLPETGPVYLHVLINQISGDLAARIVPAEPGSAFDVDATNIGWESVPILLKRSEGGSLDLELRHSTQQGGRYQLAVREYRPPRGSDEEHVLAAKAASEARRSASSGTREALASARRSYELALESWRRSGDRFGELMTLLSLSTLSYSLSDFQKGVDYSGEALELARSSGDRVQEASALNNLAMSEVSLGAIGLAREHMNGAAESFRSSGSLFAVAAARINLGLLDYQTGHWSDSIKEYAEARALAQQLHNQRLEAYALNYIALDYIALGDREGASAFLEQARVAFDQTGDRQAAARALSTLGRMKLEAGHTDDARRTIAEALTTLHVLPDRRAEADALNYLGQTVERSSRMEARARYEDALKIFRDAQSVSGESAALYNLGRLLAGNADVAEKAEGIRLLQQSAAIRHDIGVFDLEAESLFALAVAERASGNATGALAHAENAMSIVEGARREAPGEWLRSSYVAKRSEIYEFAVDLYMERHRSNSNQGDDRRAFETHERGLARSLIDRLGLSTEEVVRDVDKSLLRKASHLSDLINLRSGEMLQIYERPHKVSEEKTARARLDGALNEYRLAEAQIRASSPAYRGFSGPEAPSVEEIRRGLLSEKGSVLIEFALGEARSYAWTVTPASFRSRELPGRDRIEGLVAGFLNELHSNGALIRDDAVLPAARSVSELLKLPSANHSGAKRLLIVADGGLSRVPFAAIPLSGLRGQEPRYLVESWEVSMLPSARAGLHLRHRSASRKPAIRELAVFADPVYSPTDERFGGPFGEITAPAQYPRLAFTRHEAEAILALKPSPTNLKAVDWDANAGDAAKSLTSYRVVHFSVHAYTGETSSPESSGLVFSW